MRLYRDVGRFPAAMLFTVLSTVTYAAPAHLWITKSSSLPIPLTVSGADAVLDLLGPVDGHPGEVASLTVWAQPSDDGPEGVRKLQNLSLNIVSESGLIDILDDIRVYNPEYDTGGDSSPDARRFERVRDSTLVDPFNPSLQLETLLPGSIGPSSPDAAIGVQGSNPSTEADIYTGIGPADLLEDTTWASTPFGIAWRLAEFSVQSLSFGEERIRLRIGEIGINESIAGVLQPSAMTDVIFAPPGQTAPVYNAGPSGDRDYRDGSYQVKPGDVPELLIRITDKLAGDYNSDQRVDAADYTVWRNTLGRTGAGLPADFDGNGVIGQEDYFWWVQNYGREIPSGAEAVIAPEPTGLVSSFMILAACVVGWLYRPMAARRTPFMCSLVFLCLFGWEGTRCTAQLTWDGAAMNGVWGGDNWVEGDYSENADLTFGELDGSSTNLVTALYGSNQTNLNYRSAASITVTRQSGSVRVTPGDGNSAHYLEMRSGGITVEDIDSRLVIETDIQLRSSQVWRVLQPTGELVVRDGSTGPKSLRLIEGRELTINGPGSTTIRSDIVDTGSLVKRGDGTLLLTGDNTFSGGVTIYNGAIKVNTAAPLSSGPVALSGGILQFDGSMTVGVPISVALEVDEANRINVFAGNTLQLDATITGDGSWQKRGGGILQLNGEAINQNGIVTVEGELRLGNHNRIADEEPLTITAGGVFDTASYSDTVGFLLGSGELRLPTAGQGLTVGASGGNSVFTGTVSGLGYLRKVGSGEQVLLGAANHLGGTFIDNGVLVVQADRLAGNVVNNSELVFDQVSSGTFSGTVSGVGAVRKTGSGATVLPGSHSYSGGTFVDGGKLVVNGSATGGVTVAAGATLGGTGFVGSVSGPGRVAPGNSPGVLTINGDYTQEADSVLEIEVGGLTPGPGSPNINDGHDQVVVTGAATLDGQYEFPIINNFVPQENDEITFLTASSIAGSPNVLLAPGLDLADPTLGFQVIKNATDLKLRFVQKGALQFVDNTGGVVDEMDWHEPANWDLNEVPKSSDVIDLDRTETGNVMRVEVKNDDAFTHQFTLEDQSSPIEVAVINGRKLSSGVGELTIGDNAKIELDTGSIASGQAVQLLSGGKLSGSGTVIGNLMSTGMVSPGMDLPGMQVGAIVAEDDYTQGAGGELHIDIVSDAATGDFDTLTITGQANLDGKLMVDISSLPAVVPGEVYTIATTGGISGQFAEIEVTGASNYYVSVDYGQGFAPSTSATLAVSQAADLRLALLGLGDANADGEINEDDARVFAAVLIDNSLFGYQLSEDEFAVNNFFDAFNFYTDGEPVGRRIIDFDDIPGFIEAMQSSQGISAEVAYGVFSEAYQRVLHDSAIPEPAAGLLVFGAAGLLSLRRFGRRNWHGKQ